MKSLNPCFIGMYRDMIPLSNTEELKCLNPCFIGMYRDSHEEKA